METRLSRYFFEPGKDDVWRESVSLGKELERLRVDPSLLLFHDHLARIEPPLLDAGAFTVAAVSPDVINYKEYVKHKCMKIWLPLPSQEEIRGMKQVINPNMSDEELDERISKVGRNVRLIFGPNFQETLEELNRKIESFDVSSFLKSRMSYEAMLPSDKNGLSWWVVNVDASSDLQRPGNIFWASKYIEHEVLSSLRQKGSHNNNVFV